MPQLKAELCDLVAIPSVSEAGFPASSRLALLQTRDAVAALFEGAGCEVGSLDLPDTAPMVTGGIPAPEGAPTVLLYSHYDVVPTGDLSLWRTPPFEPTERDTSIFGRGAADTKSNIMAHVGVLLGRLAAAYARRLRPRAVADRSEQHRTPAAHQLRPGT